MDYATYYYDEWQWNKNENERLKEENIVLKERDKIYQNTITMLQQSLYNAEIRADHWHREYIRKRT